MRCPTDATGTLQRSPSSRSGGNTNGAGSCPRGRGRGFSPRPGRSRDRGRRLTNPSAESSHLRTQMLASTEFLYPIASSATCSRGIAADEDQEPRVAQLCRRACAQPFGPPLQRSSAEFPQSGILSCISHCDWQRHRVTSQLLVDE
jgi:hypothetical protein